MVSIWVIIGLIISAIAVSSLGATFSVIGLGALFSGAVLAVWAMAAALELAKFVMAAYLHQKWKSLNFFFRTYLVSAVVVLSLITSMGIFGFLSDAYQSASTVLESENIKLKSLQTQLESSKNEILRLNRAIDEIPENRISRRMKARSEAEPKITALNKQTDSINEQIEKAQLTILEVKKKVGPLIYISRSFNIEIDQVVKYLIFVLVSVFDPLAICLVIATSDSLLSRKRQSLQSQPIATSPQPPLEKPPEEEIIQMRFADESDQSAV
ncbi:MAG: hypothetical protein ACAH59_01120 [Pseudobdellovibrionaceae bacterium]